MYYAQIKDGIATELENALYAWDANNYCTPAALVADGKSDQFGVVALTYVSAPDHNPATHTAVHDGCEQIGGEWRYKWRIDALTPEQIEANQAAQREAAKASRAEAVAAIKVTTASGNTFDGDEVSQGRMARAVLALSTGLAASVTWVLADNSVIDATAAELTEALVLAGQAQANLWVIN